MSMLAEYGCGTPVFAKSTIFGGSVSAKAPASFALALRLNYKGRAWWDWAQAPKGC